MWRQIKEHPFYIRLTNWEYWPIYIVNIPTVIFWLYFAIRSRHLFFFSTANPDIKTGGLFGESKKRILDLMPGKYLPKTFLLETGELEIQKVLDAMRNLEISFPIIIKPDVGERGFLVEKIHNRDELEKYLIGLDIDVLVQEYIDYPVELSVLYHRLPQNNSGSITSLCFKESLLIVGDGKSTVEQLMQQRPRAKLQLGRLRKNKHQLLESVPNAGEHVVIEPIGNHCRGSKFLNGNRLISKQLTEVFNNIALTFDGIYYGRFDIKCKSLDHLEQNSNFSILEFNGIASEPAHVYDPSYSVAQAYRDIFYHWKIIYRIAKIQMKNGVKPISFREAWSEFKEYVRYKRDARRSFDLSAAS